MKVGHRVWATLALVAIGAGGLYWQNGGRPVVAERPVATVSASLPNIGFARDIAESISKIELTQPEPDEQRLPSHTITLEKQGPRWEVTSPLKTRASASKVAELLENLRDLKVTESVDPGTDSYDLDGLSDTRALHVVVWAGQDEVSNLYFGRTNPRGRPVRIAGADGVFVVANSGPGGYSGFLYTRGLRGWRETSILQLGQDDAIEVEVTNKNGRFRFSTNGSTWTGSLAKRDRYGKLGEPEREWAKFDPNTVEDLLRVYRSLSADDFGDEPQRAGSGVDNAEQTGGVVRIRLKGDVVERTIKVGKIATNSGPWAIKNSRWAVEEGGDGTLFALAPWTADWATADASRFENGP
jgi:hypothetical protein